MTMSPWPLQKPHSSSEWHSAFDAMVIWYMNDLACTRKGRKKRLGPLSSITERTKNPDKSL
ncbi:hypothetical protein BpHYR1_047372 [Brachionus plicatilis]|uniref:Uncharacterized protein n=1 Tax=Brachionus plicatilis TaxID=10195 RepID=A0A3M7PIJ6_BRAPC|nr:hypothetical protein BpHYR1_047372 [Brachionus plicatilis]